MDSPRYRWKLVYEDGSSFSSLDGEPHESPPWGVVACIQPGTDREVMTNSDWLMYRTDYDEWTQCGRDGFDDHAVHYGHLIGCWRKTRWMRSPDFKKIWARAREELASL